MRKKKYENIIGITGTPGSGKSFLSTYLGQKTGIEVIEFEKVFDEMLNAFPLANILGVKGRQISMNDLISVFDGGGNNIIKRIEVEIMKALANHKIKCIAKKKKDPLIIEFSFLPELGISKEFGEMYLAKGDEKLKYSKLSDRDLTTEEDSCKRVALVSSLVDYDKLQYTDIWQNDYQSMPKNFLKLVDELKQKYAKPVVRETNSI